MIDGKEKTAKKSKERFAFEFVIGVVGAILMLIGLIVGAFLSLAFLLKNAESIGHFLAAWWWLLIIAGAIMVYIGSAWRES